MKKLLTTLVIVVLAGALLAACGGGQATEPAVEPPTEEPATEEPAAAPLEGKKVCYLIPDSANAFLSALTENVKAKFAEDGVEVLIYGAEGNATTQYNQIENCISSGVNAMIVMAAVDPEGVAAAVEEAKAAGIMVMGVPVPEQGPYDAIMHTDQYEIGTLMAGMGCDFINATYPDAGDKSVEVAIISTEDTPELKKRTEGMRTIADTCSKANLVHYVDQPEATITEGMTAAENILTAYPDVKVFLVIGDSGSQGVSQAIQAYAPDDLNSYAVFSGDISPDMMPVVEGCETPYRGAVAIGGGPEELAQSTYNIVKGMISGGDFPAETLDPLITITCEGAVAEEPAAAPLEGKKVCYLIPDSANAFLSALTENVKAKFAEDGVEVLIYGAEGNATTQYNQIENCISSGVDGMIVMAAVDPEGVEAAVEEAKDAGIMVMGVPVPDQGSYDAIMHTDQYEIGTLMAGMGCDFINETYPDAADQSVEVAIISTEDTPELKKRTEGMRTIADTCSKANLVHYVDQPEATITEGMTAAENILTAYPDVKVFLVIGDSGSQGVSQAIQAYAPDDLNSYAVFSGDISPDMMPVVEGCETPYRGAVAIGGGPEELAQSTYDIVKGMISGGDFPAETLDPLITITCK